MAKMTDTEKLWLAVRDDPNITGKQYIAVKEHILGAKAVDAVEVVRCKDCKHYEEDTMWCKVNSKPRSETYPNWYADDFCSYGERKDDERKTD